MEKAESSSSWLFVARPNHQTLNVNSTNRWTVIDVAENGRITGRMKEQERARSLEKTKMLCRDERDER